MLTNTYTEVYNDILYFKSLYPDSIMNIYRHVSDYCDKLEHNGSLMYDEFPDKERIRLMARQIHNNLMTEIRSNIENGSFTDFKNEYCVKLDTRI